MDGTLRAILLSWNWDPLILVGLLVTGLLYSWAYWLSLRQPRRHARVYWAPRHAALFYGGLATIFVALISPIDPLGELVFWGHMTQHILLIMIAPPLLLLGVPLGPALHVIPISTRRPLVRYLAGSGPLRRIARLLTSPLGAFVIFNVTLWTWHIPSVYDAALRHAPLHALEHLSMLVAGVLFWWPIVEPVPVWKPGQGFWRVAYPVLASIPTGIMGVWITEAGSTPLYPFYAAMPRLWGVSVTDDQQLGGTIMLTTDEFIVFVACAVLFFRFMAEAERRQTLAETLAAHRPEVAGETPTDLSPQP